MEAVFIEGTHTDQTRKACLRILRELYALGPEPDEEKAKPSDRDICQSVHRGSGETGL